MKKPATLGMLAIILASCSGNDSGSNVEIGGSTSNSQTGGSAGVSTGGSTLGPMTTGGSSQGGQTSGGVVATGGRSTGGQSASTGGTPTTTATGGATATGGVATTGGTKSTGGASGTGGINTAGGTSNLTGGTKATGGVTAAGGTTSTGGSKATGGIASIATGGSGTGGSQSGCNPGAPTPASGSANFPFPQHRLNSHCIYPATCSDAAVTTAWAQYKSKYVVSAGSGLIRVQRVENSNDTVSEGMGYGMLFAVYMNEKTTFDGLWAYVQAHLDANGLMNWQINSSGTAIGLGSATDGDEDIGFALVMADEQWGGYTSVATAYRKGAEQRLCKRRYDQGGRWVRRRQSFLSRAGVLQSVCDLHR